MMRNKYLDELGIKPEEYGTNFVDDNDPRASLWEEERKKYGFDSRETWSLDKMFLEWLYSHLKMYQEYRKRKAEAPEILIPAINKSQPYTREEWIDMILHALRLYLVCPFCSLDEEYTYIIAQDAVRVWAEIMHYCKAESRDNQEIKGKEAELFGFTEDEIYDLPSSFATWLVERLKLYEISASVVVDLDFYKFTVEEKELTQRQCIFKIIDLIKDWQAHPEEPHLLNKATRIFADILWTMWW